MNYYSIKKNTYFNEWREDIYSILKKNGTYEKSLEIGCGSGKLSYRLKEDKIIINSTGVEPYAELIYNNFDNFYNDKIENVLDEKLSNTKYDLIILADVLEHTIDPWGILRTLADRNLEHDGVIIISLPNFRNLHSLYKIVINNSFKYEPEGVFDKTHLRFFCVPDMIELVTFAGLGVEWTAPSFIFKESKFFSQNRMKIINKSTLGFFKYWIADQVIVFTKKK